MEREEDKMLSTKEIADLLNVSQRTIIRLANREKLPGAIKVGRQWRFNKELVLSKMQKNG